MENKTTLRQKYRRVSRGVRERITSLSIIQLLSQSVDADNYEETELGKVIRPLIVTCFYLGLGFENQNFSRKKQLFHAFYAYTIGIILFAVILITLGITIHEIIYTTSLNSSIGFKILNVVYFTLCFVAYKTLIKANRFKLYKICSHFERFDRSIKIDLNKVAKGAKIACCFNVIFPLVAGSLQILSSLGVMPKSPVDNFLNFNKSSLIIMEFVPFVYAMATFLMAQSLFHTIIYVAYGCFQNVTKSVKLVLRQSARLSICSVAEIIGKLQLEHCMIAEMIGAIDKHFNLYVLFSFALQIPMICLGMYVHFADRLSSIYGHFIFAACWILVGSQILFVSVHGAALEHEVIILLSFYYLLIRLIYL